MRIFFVNAPRANDSLTSGEFNLQL